MPGGDKTYKVGEDVYNIPETESGSFLKDFPKAVEVRSFSMGKDTFDIPVPEVNDFLKEMPTAKELGGKPEPSEPKPEAITKDKQDMFAMLTGKADKPVTGDIAALPGVTPDTKVEKLYEALPAMKAKKVRDITTNNLMSQGKIGVEGKPVKAVERVQSDDYNREKQNVERGLRDEDWMPSIFLGNNKEGVKKAAVDKFAAANKEDKQKVQDKLDSGDYILEDGKVKVKGDFLDNLQQGAKDFLKNIGLALNVAGAQANKNTDAEASNEIKYHMNEFFKDKANDKEYAATDLPGQAGKLLGGIAPYTIPYADIPLMGLSNLGANHQEIWGDPTLSDDQKARAIINTSNDAFMIGAGQAVAFSGLHAGEPQLSAKQLLSQYAPTSNLKQKFAQGLYDNYKELLKPVGKDLAAAASVGAGTELLNSLNKAKEGVNVDFKKIPEAALEMATLDLVMKAPKVLTSAFSTIRDARRSGLDKTDPRWFNQYSKQTQDALNNIVAAPEAVYKSAIDQLDNSPDVNAATAKQKIETFRNYYNSLPADLPQEAKNKALHILQLKTEAMDDMRNASDPTIRKTHETRALAYDGLLQKVISGKDVDTKKEPLLISRFAAPPPPPKEEPQDKPNPERDKLIEEQKILSKNPEAFKGRLSEIEQELKGMGVEPQPPAPSPQPPAPEPKPVEVVQPPKVKPVAESKGTVNDFNGKEVVYNGESGILAIDEGGKVTVETPKKVYEVADAKGDSKIEDFGIGAKEPKYTVSKVSNDAVTVNDVDYKINTDDKGNVVSLSPANKPEQQIKNDALVTAVEIERNKQDTKDIHAAIDNDASHVEKTLVDNGLIHPNAVNTLLNINMNDTVDKAMTKMDNGEPLSDQEALQLETWAFDAIDRLSQHDDKATKEVQEGIHQMIEELHKTHNNEQRTSPQTDNTGTPQGEKASPEVKTEAAAETKSEPIKPESDALQINSARKVLSSEPQEAGSTGGERGGVEQVKQGDEAAGAGGEAAPSPKDGAGDGKKKKVAPLSDTQKAHKLEDITEPRDLVMQHFVAGGKVHSSAIQELFGGKDERLHGTAYPEGEKRARIGLLSKTGKTLDGLAHQLFEHDPTGNYTTQDYRNAIEQVLTDHTSAGSMAKELVRKYEQTTFESEFTKAEMDGFEKDLFDKRAAEVEGLAPEVKKELTDLLSDYQDKMGYIDWEKLREDSDGFDPKMLSLSDGAAKSLEEILDKRKPGQGEPDGTDNENAAGAGQEAAETTKPEAPPEVDVAQLDAEIEAAQKQLDDAEAKLAGYKPNSTKVFVEGKASGKSFGQINSNRQKEVIRIRKNNLSRLEGIKKAIERNSKSDDIKAALKSELNDTRTMRDAKNAIDYIYDKENEAKESDLNQPITNKAKAKAIAAKWDEVADKIGSFKFGEGAMLDITAIPRQVIRLAIKGAARLIEAGGSIADAVEHVVGELKKYHQENNLDYKGADIKKAANDLLKTVGLIPGEHKVTKKGIMDAASSKITGDKVVLSQKEALKKQIRDFARGFGEGRKVGVDEGIVAGVKAGVKRGAEIMKAAQEGFARDISKYLKEATFGGKLTEAQAKAIARKAANVGGNANKMIDFVEYAEKVIDDVQYAEKFDGAKQLQKKLAKYLSSDKKFTNNVDILRTLKRLPLNKLSPEHLDEFIRMATEYRNAQRSPTDQAYLPFDTTKNKAALEKIQKQLEIDADNALISKAEEASGVLFLSADEARTMLEALKADDVDQFADNLTEAKQKQLRNALEQRAAYSQMAVRQSMADSDYLDQVHPRAQAILKRVAEADLSVLNNKNLVELIKGIDNALLNGTSANIGRLDAMVQAKEAVAPLTAITSKNKIFDLNVFQTAFEDLPVLMKAMYGLTKTVAEFRRQTGWDKVFNGGAKAKKALLDKLKSFDNFLKSNNISKEPDDVFRRGMYGHAVQHEGGTPEEINQRLANNKSLIEQSIAAYKEDKGTRKMGEQLQAIYDADIKPFDNMDDLMKHFATTHPDTVKAHGFWEQTFADMKEDIKFVTEAYHNKFFEGDNVNYTPRGYNFIDRELNHPPGEPVMSFNNYVGKPQQNANSITRVVEKKLPAGMALDFNFDYQMLKSFKKAQYDIHTTEGQFVFSEFMKAPESKEIVGGANNKKIIKEQYQKAEQVQSGLQVDDDIAAGIIKGVADTVRNVSSTAALGGITAYPKQYFSVAVKTLGTLGSDAGLFFDVQKVKLKDLPLLEQTAIALRGEQRGGTNTGSKDDVLRSRENILNNVIQKGYQGVSQWLTKNRARAMKSLEEGDVRVAKRSFLAYYMKYMKEQGVNVTVNDLYTEHTKLDETREKALAYAQQMVDESQLVSNSAMMSDFKRPTGNFYKNLVKTILLPFNSFASNTRTRMIEDGKFIFLGNGEQRREAWRDALTSVSEVLVYQGINTLLLTALIKYPAHELFDHLFGVGDSDPKTFKDRMMMEWKKFYSNSLKDTLVSGLGNNLETGFLEGLNQIGWYLHSVSSPEDKTPKHEWLIKNAWFFAYDKANPTWLDRAGTFGVWFNEAQQTGQDIKGALSGKTKADNSYVNEASVDDGDQSIDQITGLHKTVPLTIEEQRFMFFQTLLDLTFFAGLSDADLKRLADAKKREILAKESKLTKTKRSLYRALRQGR